MSRGKHAIPRGERVETFVMKEVTIHSKDGKYVFIRRRSTSGLAEIVVKKNSREVLAFRDDGKGDGMYGVEATEFCEHLDEIANNPCHISKETMDEKD